MNNKVIVQKAGKVYGSGTFGEVVDVSELVDIKFYDTNLTLINAKFPLDGIVLKRFKKLKNAKNISVEEFIDFVVKRKSNIDKLPEGLPSAYEDVVTEVANMTVLAALPIKTPLAKLRTRTILFAVVNKNEILPVYRLYDGDLSHALKENIVDIKVFLQITRKLLQTVKVLHDNNLYHFDIKPVNILYKKIGNDYDFSVTDYGFLGSIYSNGYAGTPRYQSPLTTFRHECDDDDDPVRCQEKINSYREISDLYNMTGLKVSLAAETCHPDSEHVKSVLSECGEHSKYMMELASKLSNRMSYSKIESLVKNIQQSITELCGTTNNASTFESKCDSLSVLSREIMGVIFQKNELHAIGITLEDLFKAIKKVHSIDDRLSQMIDDFIKHLTHATLFQDTNTSQQDIYFCDEALEFFDNIIVAMYHNLQKKTNTQTAGSMKRKPKAVKKPTKGQK